MNEINRDALASITFEIKWKSADAAHTDILHAPKVNFWRDILPGGIAEALEGRGPGGEVRARFAPGQFLAGRSNDGLKSVDKRKFETKPVQGHRILPRFGRFYPQGLLHDVPGAYPAGGHPFRITEVSSESIGVDLNHPMAGRDVEFAAKVDDVRGKIMEIGGRISDWGAIAASGPGMQAKHEGGATDFFSGDSFARQIDSLDGEFYRRPRLTAHLDSRAAGHVADLYERLIPADARVLDLMSSYRTHMNEGAAPAHIVGLGINAEELAANGLLSDRLVHDVNANPELPFGAGEFDAVVCNVSVEYMTKPFEVFDDVARVLRPGGLFVVTFSNRWFPDKVVRLWTELHEFERMQLVMDYFLSTGKYGELETMSLRGWKRPWDPEDRYAGSVKLSDPVFAVWGRTNDA